VKAAILHETRQPMVIEDVELDAPRAEEVRIRVVASGLCHSDYHFMVGDMPCPVPALLGHEASGIIEAVGEDVRGLKPGDQVVTCFSAYCGECGQCQTGHTHRCDDKPARPATPADARVRLRGQPVFQFGGLGGFAEEMLVHSHAVTKLPEGMPLDLAALLGCAVITGVGAAVNRAKVGPGQTVVVIGCGGVGLNVIQGAKIAGAGRVIAVDLNPSKLELAKVFGATDTVLGGEQAVAEVVELTNGGVDAAFEVIGLAQTARQAAMMLRKGGTAVMVGVPKAGTEFAFPASPFLSKEISVTSTIMGSAPFQLFVPKLAQLYLDGVLKLDPLVSQRIPLADINRGYEQMVAGDVARSLITF
jgi:S-(hydroxymethyl)glutathione dehydrogenase / alcohol dehydrogenase